MLELKIFQRPQRHCFVATAIVGSAAIGAIGSGISAAGQGSAAGTSAGGVSTIEGYVAPYNAAGQKASGNLAGLTGVGGNPLTAPLTAPFQPTMTQLAATPGYQFTLNQGLQGVENGYASQGLGRSGAALKGAANYAEGLASTTYEQQFQNYLQQNQQIYNMLYNQAALGEGAGVGVAPSVVSGTGQQAGYTAGMFNSLAGGAQNVGNSLLAYGMYNSANNAANNPPATSNTWGSGTDTSNGTYWSGSYGTPISTAP